MLPLNYYVGWTLMEPNAAIVTFLESKLGLFRAQGNKATLGMALRTSTVLGFPSKMKPVRFLRLQHVRPSECELAEMTSFKNM